MKRGQESYLISTDSSLADLDGSEEDHDIGMLVEDSARTSREARLCK